jgi:hypothetical protein
MAAIAKAQVVSLHKDNSKLNVWVWMGIARFCGIEFPSYWLPGYTLSA